MHTHTAWPSACSFVYLYFYTKENHLSVSELDRIGSFPPPEPRNIRSELKPMMALDDSVTETNRFLFGQRHCQLAEL